MRIKKILVFLFSIMFCVTILVQLAYSDDPKVTWPTPKILRQGEVVQEDVFVFTEKEFENLLWLKSYYRITEKEWSVKEKMYEDGLKKLQKKAKIPFWRTYKAGFIIGVTLFVLAAYAIGQVK